MELPINTKETNIPDEIINKWQSIVNIMADIIRVPAALIMEVEPPYIEVFRSSESSDNPYKVGDREHLAGLYCEKVITTRDKLLVPNALKDADWDRNPDIKLGMVSYLGFPLFWPDGEIFGTICVLDSKENHYSKVYEELLFQFKELVEAHLGLLYQEHKLESIITERKQVEEALQQYAKRLEILREIDQAILAAQSPANIAQVASRHIRQLVPCQRVSVAMFDLEAHEATVLTVDINGKTTVGAETRVSLEVFGDIELLRRGRIHVVEDILTFSQPSPVIQALRADGVRSYINVPLISQDELIGTLNLGSNRTGAFSEEQIEIAREVANSLAITIQQAHLHEQVQRYATEMEQRVAEHTSELSERVAEVEQLNLAMANLLEDLQTANRNLEGTTRKLREANAELEAFAYSVSHDLRAPLRGMEGFANALLEDYGEQLDSVGQDYARRVVAAAQRMDTLINDLLIYSRLTRDEIKLKSVSLELVMEEVLTQLEAEIREKDAQMTVEKPLPEVVGRHTTLVQVVSNLVTNAIKFVAPDVQPQVRIWAEERDERVRLWVEDNGIGIAPEHQERIFQIFERLHGIETYPGTGIGLAIAHKGVERMEGQVGVESEVGKGSRFCVELLRV